MTSKRDPIYHGRYSPLRAYDMGLTFNPMANDFAPNDTQQNGTASQVSAPPSPYLEARILNLDEGHADIRGEIESLKELYHGISFFVDTLKKGGWPVHVGPFQEVDVKKSHQDAMQFSQELRQLKDEVRMSVNGGTDVQKANGMAPSKTNGSVPPHLRTASVTSGGTVTKSLPPHLRKKMSANGNGTMEHLASPTPNNRLHTDGQVDPVLQRFEQIQAPALSPPASPETVVQDDLPSIEDLSLDEPKGKGWQPYHLTTLPASLARIPSGNTMTFHPDFLDNTLGGTVWSPGLRFVQGKGPCILQDRTYYQLDPANEPFLPKKPGEHGAKLTAFFNRAPEEAHADLLDSNSNTYEDVPMFILVGGRYVYFGNYSQTRWSDKLDYDTTVARVPQHVKDFWADELTATTREPWITEELKNHFFRKPEYIGHIVAAQENATTVDTAEEIKLNKKMTQDVRDYVDELRAWEREAKMKTAMIKKQFILNAFGASDMDDPPALRLWWEYLECVDYRQDFYDLLCQLQTRDDKRYLKHEESRSC